MPGCDAAAPLQVDYLSLDLEGSELAALRSLAGTAIIATIAAATVEDKARGPDGPSESGRAVRELLGRAGFRLATMLAQDDVFVRR